MVSLKRRPSIQTESKAFITSKKTAPVSSFSQKNFLTHPTNQASWRVMLSLSQNSNYSSLRRPWELISAMILESRIFSKSFLYCSFIVVHTNNIPKLFIFHNFYIYVIKIINILNNIYFALLAHYVGLLLLQSVSHVEPVRTCSVFQLITQQVSLSVGCCNEFPFLSTLLNCLSSRENIPTETYFELAHITWCHSSNPSKK